MARKTKTLDQIRAMQEKAVRFLRDVIGDPDKAEEFDNMTTEEYAGRKRVTIENPFPCRTKQRRLNTMARPTYADLQGRVTELEEENQALNEKLDSIMDIATNEEEDEEDDEEEDDDE